jgi:hypothetical protein
MRGADHPAAAWVLAGLAFALAATGARDQPGGFNDGSRLATAESLVERGTLAIDDSVFVIPPPDLRERGLLPEDPNPTYSLARGTKDKLLIGGRYYSDKPMIPAVVNAAGYRLLMLADLPRPADRPDVFTRVSTILLCGVGYAVAVGCMWVLGKQVGLAPAWRLVWLAGFALATLLPAYSRQLNAGVPQLAAAAGLAVLLSRVAGGDARRWILVGGGTCAGFGFTVDQASGAPLLALAAGLVVYRTRRVGPTALFLVGALPWVAAHHAVNYAIGRVWVPLNMVPEYLEWPGSPFDRSNMTGLARHTPLGLAYYLRELLVGESGFLVFNLPLFLAVAMGWRVLARPVPDRPELAAMILWSVAVVVVYAVLSDNLGGYCLSIRWFVPLLVPGFWVLARLLVECPTLRLDFAVLSAWGLVVSWRSWPAGPWLVVDQPYVLGLARAALATWLVVRVLYIVRRRARSENARASFQRLPK